MYITLRAVFEIVQDWVMLPEIAPGIDLQKDALDRMQIKPVIAGDLREMDPRISTRGTMNIREGIMAKG